MGVFISQPERIEIKYDFLARRIYPARGCLWSPFQLEGVRMCGGRRRVLVRAEADGAEPGEEKEREPKAQGRVR